MKACRVSGEGREGTAAGLVWLSHVAGELGVRGSAVRQGFGDRVTGLALLAIAPPHPAPPGPRSFLLPSASVSASVGSRE